MNVSLTPELERLVSDKVEAGLYASASEVVREALRLLHERDVQQEARLLAIRTKIAVGLADLDAGRVSHATAEDIIRKGRAHVTR
jgi:antitoxin ParD1/3/4